MSAIQLCDTTNIHYSMFRPVPKTYRLGSKERNELCNHTVVQHVAAGSETEEALLMTPFKSMDEWNEYRDKTDEIKNVIAKANHLREMGVISEMGLRTRIANVWYPLTLQFVKQYGKEMVPFDIRWAINNVEENCFESSLTKWPRHVLYEK